MQEKLILLLSGILGVTAHCLIKAQSLKTDAEAANIKWKFSDYINKDWLGILLSFCSVLIWLLLFEEVAIKYHKIQDYVRGTFVLMGLAGSYLIQTVLSKAKKQIRTKVDNATNELDSIKNDEKG